jgi:hypothetical protein
MPEKGIARVWRAEAGRRSVQLARAAAAAQALIAVIDRPAGTVGTWAKALNAASNNYSLPPDDLRNALAQADEAEAALRLAVGGRIA